ncbi:MAG: hypothetical protein ACFB15_14190 [Cyclobacteriaceae bacterium]
MKSIQLQFIAILITSITTLLISSANGQTGYGNVNPTNQYSTAGVGQNTGSGQKVEVYDQGLQMSTGSYTVPAGWQIVQDFATDPNTGQPLKQKMDIVGPQGELLRSLGMTQYAAMMGTNFDESWRKTALAGLRGELGQEMQSNLSPSARMQQNQMIKQYAQTAASQGFKLECLEASISGNRNGQPYQGVVSIIHLTPANMPNMGTIQLSFTICPANQLQQTISIGEQVANSFQPNPQYQQRLQQIQQRMMDGYGNNPNQRQPNYQDYSTQPSQPVDGGYPSQNNQYYEQYSPNTQYGQESYPPANSTWGNQNREPNTWQATPSANPNY